MWGRARRLVVRSGRKSSRTNGRGATRCACQGPLRERRLRRVPRAPLRRGPRDLCRLMRRLTLKLQVEAAAHGCARGSVHAVRETTLSGRDEGRLKRRSRERGGSPRRSSRRRACAARTTTNPASTRGPHRVPVETAAAGDRGPGRGRPALQGPPRLPRQVDVLEQQQRPARDEDPAELGERRRRVRHRAERERAHGGVEARVRERQLLGAALDDGDAARRPAPPAAAPAPACEASGSSAVTAVPGAYQRELRAGARADLEHAPARARRRDAGARRRARRARTAT